MEINYNTKIVGNKREITAVLPDKRWNLIQSMKKCDYRLPFVENSTLKEVDLHFFFSDEKGKCYVKLKQHKFVANITTVERLIEAADKFLEIMAK